jgi:hypothetical protein
MRIRRPNPRSYALALLMADTLLALGACGVSATGTGASTSSSRPAAHLRCMFHEQPRASEPSGYVFNGAMWCQVSGAASDETAFALTYSLNGMECRGSLVRGAGTCGVDFLIKNPLSSLGKVAGELLPSHRPLGPVAPLPTP